MFVLLIEDDPGIASLIHVIFTLQHHEVKAVVSGSEARSAIDLRVPDVILLDNVLPGELGPSVCSSLTADARLLDVPVILVTAQTDAGSLLTGLQAGATAYLMKPFHSDELLGLVEGVIAMAPPERTKLREDLINRLAHAHDM